MRGFRTLFQFFRIDGYCPRFRSEQNVTVGRNKRNSLGKQNIIVPEKAVVADGLARISVRIKLYYLRIGNDEEAFANLGHHKSDVGRKSVRCIEMFEIQFFR